MANLTRLTSRKLPNDRHWAHLDTVLDAGRDIALHRLRPRTSGRNEHQSSREPLRRSTRRGRRSAPSAPRTVSSCTPPAVSLPIYHNSHPCFSTFVLLISARLEENRHSHSAQDDLSSVDLSPLTGAAAGERHRHRFQRSARQGRRRQIHATAQGPRLFRHLRHARPGL